jgi:protein TonB
MRKEKYLNHFHLVCVAMIMMTCFLVTTGAYGQVNSSKKTELPPPPPPPPPAPDKNSDNSSHDGVFQEVDIMPAFPGGEGALMQTIADSIRYPKDAKEKGITGKVIVRFMVKYDGTVTDVSVLKGVSPSLDNEAVRVVQSLPKFSPGQLKGKSVSVWYMLPVLYSLK